jgi:signal transduction histidine kinase
MTSPSRIQPDLRSVVPIELLTFVIDGQPDEAIAIFDTEFRLLTANKAWSKATGVGPDRFGLTMADLFGAFDAGVDFFKTLLGGTEIVVTTDAHHQGEMGQITLFPWKDGRGQVAAVVSRHSVAEGSARDAQARESRLRMAMDMAKISLFQSDFRTGETQTEPRGNVQAIESVFSHEDTLKIVPEKDRQRQRELWQAHLANREPIWQEVQTYDNDGQLRWYRSLYEAVYSQTGEVIGMVGVTQQIDDRKQAEIALVAEKEAAEAANRAKSEFLANVSHEIRTPLNGVVGIASVLAKTALAPAQREMVQTIENSAQTLNALLSDILDLAKIESGRLELEPAPFDTREVVAYIDKLFSGAAAAKGLTLAYGVDVSAQGLALADRVRLTQILINLVNNAIKFTAKGSVALRAWAEGEGEARQLHIAVSDTGIGISPEAKSNLFQRFVQADGSISRSFGGTGLGLAISRNLAQLMGGDIEATSQSGVGSTFTVSIRAPSCDEDAGPSKAVESRPSSWIEGAAPLVLLAEDHPVNRKVVELILGDLVSLECVENGQEAVAAVSDRPFDLILMDMQMPVMDGLEATRVIRDIERRVGSKAIPIIMLSANALAEHVKLSREAGAEFHLPKPITADALISAVERALEAGRINDNDAVHFPPDGLVGAADLA